MKIGFKNNRQNIISSSEISELQDIVWKDAPQGFDASTDFATLVNDTIVVITLEQENTRTAGECLRVYRVLPKDLDPLISDFTILGFRKESPSYDRGRKTQSRYMCIAKDEEIVVKTFSDVRDVNNILSGLQVEFKYYNEDGNIGLTKTEIVKSYNKYEAQTEERKRRERQLDYMIASGKNTPIEPYINVIFHHYAIQEQQYRTHGSSDLADAIENETDPTILAILNTMTITVEDNHPDWPNGCTVGQGITYQITGVK